MTYINMDTVSYNFLRAKTQEALSSDATEELQSTSFKTLLKDCNICINQSLNIVSVLLSEEEVCIAKLTEYLNDSISLLELLCNFIKTVIESEMITCQATNTFPTSVGLIIVNVFSHCKDSEQLYSKYLTGVEKQLKDLFRNCHNLQLTYLMVLEKHFVFDLNDIEEKKVLLEALDINLRIGETVQSLDVKTMAVQWKAMTVTYEKYSAILADTSVFQDCMAVLCSLIRSKIETAVEIIQDDKIVMRSLKVANFLLKTLLKLCDIFGHATKKEYSNVINLLFYIHEASANLQTPAERSQFINLLENPSESLLKKLLYDETFGESLLNCDIEKIKQEGSFMGFVLTITAVMNCLTKGHKNKTVTKSKLIICLYSILPHCNSRNLNVRLWSEVSQQVCLLEHLLIHGLALALTLNCEEFALLERSMAEAILSTNHISALFSSNIWALLHMARDINPQLLFNQITWLCTMYQKLEKHSMFHRSPQKIHLTHTIARLFALMENDDKMKICKQFRIHDDNNLSLWTALGVNSLPEEAKRTAELVIAEKLKTQFQSLHSDIGREKMDTFIKVMGLAATCAFSKGSEVEDYIMAAWSKTCSECQLPPHVESGAGAAAGWYYDYLQALIALTDSMWHHLRSNNVNLIMMLRHATGVIQQCGDEFKLLFVNILCKLATTDICESNDFTTAFACLYQNTEDNIVRNKLFITLKQYRHKNIDRILSKVGDHSLHDRWCEIRDGSNCIEAHDINDIDFKFVHKCLERKDIESRSSVSELKKQSSGNFDFADNVDKLFEAFEESPRKKIKLDSSDVEAIIKKLESETALLRTMKENVFSAECKSRIQNVCDELCSIIN